MKSSCKKCLLYKERRKRVMAGQGVRAKLLSSKMSTKVTEKCAKLRTCISCKLNRMFLTLICPFFSHPALLCLSFPCLACLPANHAHFPSLLRPLRFPPPYPPLAPLGYVNACRPRSANIYHRRPLRHPRHRLKTIEFQFQDEVVSSWSENRVEWNDASDWV